MRICRDGKVGVETDGAEPVSGGFEPVAGSRVEEDSGACGGEPEGDLQAKTPARAGHQRDFVAESEGLISHFLSPVIVRVGG